MSPCFSVGSALRRVLLRSTAEWKWIILDRHSAVDKTKHWGFGRMIGSASGCY